MWKAIPSMMVVYFALTLVKTEAQTTASGSTIGAESGPALTSPLPAGTAASQTAAPSVQVSPQALLQQVELLRAQLAQQEAETNARIAQLEAEIKAQSAASESAKAIATTPNVVVSPAMPPTQAAAPVTESRAQKIADAIFSPRTQPAPLVGAIDATPEFSAQTTKKGEPFPGDWTWVNNNGHQKDSPMATKYFTPEFRIDANYTIDMNHPEDDSLGGSTETFRSDEWQLDQVSLGGDFRIDNVRGRILYMDGLDASTTPRNDPSVNRGQWSLDVAYKYLSEAWGGYHWDVNHGLNVDAGIFASYIGLASYYNFDNWTYQPSFVSSNTPWFFNGFRVQWFPTAKLKIEPWFINGWQSYARPNGKPGLGGQILWMPKPYLYLVWNNYGMGEDDPGFPERKRIHADYSAEVKYYDRPSSFFDKAAFTLTGDLGCEYGGGPVIGHYNANGSSPEQGSSSTYSGGVNCHNSSGGRPKQMMAGWMGYTRFWFKKDLFAVTLGGGQMNNPGRYLTLLPPINGATAITGSPYFTTNGGDAWQGHDGTITFDYMPSQFITFRAETGYRYASVPYWTGHRGITPPGGNNGNPANYQCAAGGDSGQGYGNLTAAENYCIAAGLANGANPGSLSALWWPDLRTNQTVATLAIMIRF